MSKTFRHYVPASKRVQGFPFSFDVEEVEDGRGVDTTFTFTYGKGDLLEEINLTLQTVFNFSKYLDKDSLYYLRNFQAEDKKRPVYYIGVEVVQDKEIVNKIKIKCFNFDSIYSYTRIKSIEHLKEVLEGATALTYDVETSGLDPENDIVAGINFTTNKDKYTGYYIPINHRAPYNKYNLGQEAFDIYYEAMVKADKVYMFNARFDIRNAEYQSYTFNKEIGEMENIKYDMSKVKFIDTQIAGYFADPAWKVSSMSFMEKHFLGFHRLTLEETMKIYGRNDFDTTSLDPNNLLFYAGQDGITTFALGEVTEPFIEEFGLSGQIDMEIIYPLMKLENRLIRIDTEYVEQELKKLDKRLKELGDLIKSSIGVEINLNSPVQKVKLFESFGLDTKVKTQKGAMSTSKDAVDAMIARMDAAGEEYPEFLKYLGEQSKLQQLRSTFFYSLKEQMYHRDGRVRLNYRHGNTSTGRFSSGKEI